MKLSRSGIIALLIAAALSLYALAGIAATESAAAEYGQRLEELSRRAGELERENAGLERSLALSMSAARSSARPGSSASSIPGETVFVFAGGRDNSNRGIESQKCSFRWEW